MKRIVFCFDGTACALSANTPTNVVLTAASISRIAKDGTAQIIYYDEGVGTDWYNKIVGGGIGWGLIENVREAYRFLIFNYDPGDEIFVFGFSRGAFSARSFIGLIRFVGPIRRLHASRIDEAINLYHKRVKDVDRSSENLQKFRASYSDVCIDEDDENWRAKSDPSYEKGAAPIIKIKYLGVWDTVSALGAPEVMPGSSQINVGYRFHDTSVTKFIDSARHAVAIDERRSLFPPVSFGELVELNKDRGFQPDDINAPYHQERFFPGDHGSIGGGGDIRGLSDGALAWVLKGAKRAGLELDSALGTRIRSIAPNPLSPLENMKNVPVDLLYLTFYQLKRDRIGPENFWQLSSSVLRRWKADESILPEKTPYRPATLQKLKSIIDEYVPPAISETTGLLATHQVVQGDTLYGLAERYYRDKTKYKRIFEANTDTLDDPNELFIGWELRIPSLT